MMWWACFPFLARLDISHCRASLEAMRDGFQCLFPDTSNSDTSLSVHTSSPLSSAWEARGQVVQSCRVGASPLGCLLSSFALIFLTLHSMCLLPGLSPSPARQEPCHTPVRATWTQHWCPAHRKCARKYAVKERGAVLRNIAFQRQGWIGVVWQKIVLKKKAEHLWWGWIVNTEGSTYWAFITRHQVRLWEAQGNVESDTCLVGVLGMYSRRH